LAFRQESPHALSPRFSKEAGVLVLHSDEWQVMSDETHVKDTDIRFRFCAAIFAYSLTH
jgi:hypothetical protein